MPIFDEEFFRQLRKMVGQIIEFFKNNWFWGIIFLAILLAAIIIQQIILNLLISFV